MDDWEDRRGPGLRFPPPVIPAGLIGSGWLLDRWNPLPITDNAQFWWPGSAVIVLALLIALTAVLQFLRSKTSVEPWQPTSAIIHNGLFRYSRNPIYLAFCIGTLGAGMLFNSWWIVLAVVPLVLLLQGLVIRKEEAYLQAKFGDAYLDYQRRVRRWL